MDYPETPAMEIFVTICLVVKWKLSISNSISCVAEIQAGVGRQAQPQLVCFLVSRVRPKLRHQSSEINLLRNNNRDCFNRSLGMTHQLKVLASNDGLEKDEGLSTGLVRRGGQEILQLHPEQLDTMLLQSPLPAKDQKYF